MTLIVITLLRDFHKNNLTNFVGGRIKYTDLRVECKQLSAQRQSRGLTHYTNPMQIKRIGKKESIVSGIKNFRGQNKRAIIKNGVSDDGLIMCLAPCFKSGGFDIYSNRRIARELDALLACLGLEKPVLIRQRPIGIRQQDGYFYKIVSGVKRNGDLHKGKE